MTQWKVREWREELLLTQEDVAERAGCTRVTVSDLERGLRDTQPRTVRAIAKALKVSLEQLRSGPPKRRRAA